jgi:hypothetical protein
LRGNRFPTIILESRLDGTSLDWSLVQLELAKRTQVCSYDRAALGWSETNPENPPRTLDQFKMIQRLEPLGLLRIIPLPGSESLVRLPVETQQAIRAVVL